LRWAATVLVLFALATILVVGVAEGASAQAQPTTSEPATSETTGPDTSTPESTAPESTTPPGPILSIEGNGSLVIVGLAGLLVVVVWYLPLAFDLRRAYQAQTRAWDLLTGRFEQIVAGGDNPTSSDDLVKLMRAMRQPPVGMRGLYRALMAFVILTVVAIALTALLLSGSPDAGDLRKTVITALLSILGTIVGFYFGARTEADATTPDKPQEGTEDTRPKDGNGEQQGDGDDTSPSAGKGSRKLLPSILGKGGKK
jgi:hypothetical protein